MRYTAEHKAQTRERLLNEAGALAKDAGFAVTGVDALMKRIGLSGAAFYSHFDSKEALFAELIERELDSSLLMVGAAPGANGREQLQATLKRYLSLAHVEHPDKGCVLPTLGVEVARASETVREQTQQQLQQVVDNWGQILGDTELAWAVLAQCLGSLLLARMLATRSAQEQVLQASHQLLSQHLPADA